MAVLLEAPLSDMVGFEHAPENGDQFGRMEAVTWMLADAIAMVRLAAFSDCVIEETVVDGPAYLARHLLNQLIYRGWTNRSIAKRPGSRFGRQV